VLNPKEKNIVLYDWLSFTSKVHSPDELINALGLGHVPWSETKGARGYRDRKYFSCISIHYNGRDDMGVWVEMSGQGCRTFESLSTIKWEDLFKFIHKNDLHMTRLDVAFDDHTGILPMDEIISDAQAGMFVSRMNYWETVLSSKGATVQIGSPQSKVLIRIYDKAAERGYDSDVHWIRCEMQLRDSRAFEFTKIEMPIGQAFAGVLLNYLRFVEPDPDDSNKHRWPMKDYWAALVGDAEKISIFSAPGMEYNEERCKNYVINQAGNAVDACLRMYGVTEFRRMLDERGTRRNPKYDMIVDNHRLMMMQKQVQTWFTVEDDPPYIPPEQFPASIPEEELACDFGLFGRG